MSERQDGFILLEGLYTDGYIPLGKFDAIRFEGMLQRYDNQKVLLLEDKERVRDYVQITYVDNEYTPSTEEQTRAILKSRGKRVDKLRMSLLS